MMLTSAAQCLPYAQRTEGGRVYQVYHKSLRRRYHEDEKVGESVQAVVHRKIIQSTTSGLAC